VTTRGVPAGTLPLLREYVVQDMRPVAPEPSPGTDGRFAGAGAQRAPTVRERRHNYGKPGKTERDDPSPRRLGSSGTEGALAKMVAKHCSELPEPSRPAAPARWGAGEPSSIQAEPSEPRTGEEPQAVRDRIAALKPRSRPTSDVGTSFRFDPAQPLTLPAE
jgi:hypothetical protein